LADYWERWANTSGNAGHKPSAAVRRRLLAACESQPEKLPRLLSLFHDDAETAERVKKLYDATQDSAALDEGWRESVRAWLKFNSKYFIGELLAQARKVRDKGGHVENQDALAALAKVDPEMAGPMLKALAVGGQPRTAAASLALLYSNARAAKDSAEEETYRARLLAVATDRDAPAHARDTAVEVLTLTGWPGRDDWYLSLFEDATLRRLDDGGTRYSPLTYLCAREHEKWIPVMSRMVEGKNQTVRDAAAECLIVFQNREARRDALLPLLPWLSNPDWAKDDGDDRLRLIQSMDFIDVPESVPGLIWVVGHDESEYNRSYAAESLAKYKDPRAVPVLKKTLAVEKDEGHRARIIEGLLACGGIPEAEQMAALETYAAKLITPEGRADVERYRSYGDAPLPLPVSIGGYLARQKEAPDSLVLTMLARAEALRKVNPTLARAMFGVAEGWQARQVALDMLRRVRAGTADAATIANALDRRDKLRESVLAELQVLASGSGAPQGVAAIILADDALAQGIMASTDEPAQLALLACARLTQTPLPVEQVGPLLRSKNPELQLAAERYLLAEDGEEARSLLWARHPGEAFVTGWRENVPLIGGSDFSAMDGVEQKLRAELYEKEDAPLEVFALFGNDGRPLHVLRVYPGSAVYTHYEDAARYRKRAVTAGKLGRFKNFVTTNNLLDLGPQIGPCHYDCWVTEFLSLRREGGRRVFSHRGAGAWATLLANFELLGREGAKIHYRLEDENKGTREGRWWAGRRQAELRQVPLRRLR
jgi:HEAT repeat protein